MPSIPFIKQLDAMDCGPTCLALICRYYVKSFNIQALREKAEIGKEGISLLGISKAAESIGYRTQGVQLTMFQLINEAPMPCILHWNQNHFVVLLKTKKNKLTIADPGQGIVKLNKNEFQYNWQINKEAGVKKGIALLLEPTPDFYKQEDDKEEKLGWGMLSGYFAQQKKYIFQLFIGCVQLISATLPFNFKNTSLGVKYPNFLTGLLFISFSTLLISAFVTKLKSVFLGKNVLIIPFLFLLFLYPEMYKVE